MLLYGLCDIVRRLCSSNDFHVFVFEEKISTFGNSASDLFKVVVRLGTGPPNNRDFFRLFHHQFVMCCFTSFWPIGSMGLFVYIYYIYIYIYTVSPHCIHYPLLGPIKINHPTSQFTNLPTVYLYPHESLLVKFYRGGDFQGIFGNFHPREIPFNFWRPQNSWRLGRF